MQSDESSTGTGVMNRLYQAFADAREPILDLIDTNFHRCGFRFPAAPLAAGASLHNGGPLPQGSSE